MKITESLRIGLDFAMSANKFYKQSGESAGNNLAEPADRLVWEMRNFRQYYGKSPNLTPSSTVLNSPDLDHDRMEYYHKFSDELRNDLSDDFTDNRYENRLVSGRSPTSSHSSNSENCFSADPKKKVIGNMQIANLQESPRRFGVAHQSELPEPRKENFRLPMGGPRRAPGFPQVSDSATPRTLKIMYSVLASAFNKEHGKQWNCQ